MPSMGMSACLLGVILLIKGVIIWGDFELLRASCKALQAGAVGVRMSGVGCVKWHAASVHPS